MYRSRTLQVIGSEDFHTEPVLNIFWKCSYISGTFWEIMHNWPVISDILALLTALVTVERRDVLNEKPYFKILFQTIQICTSSLSSMLRERGGIQSEKMCYLEGQNGVGHWIMKQKVRSYCWWNQLIICWWNTIKHKRIILRLKEVSLYND